MFVNILYPKLLLEITDIFHLHIITDTSNFDEESLEVNCDFFFHSFSELAAALWSVTRISVHHGILRVEITLLHLLAKSRCQ